jgi:peptidoglycan/LPS O-acetylase OafA/YrhL
LADAPRSALRIEIQLLRALAVLAVVGNHLSPGLIHGGYLGVDIFFVISGYLISSHLLRELDREHRLGLGRFWARRARRLLPASLLVLLVSCVASAVLLPATMWQLVMRQIAACALYVQNWQLAANALDYFTSSSSPSPVTHYWSLSVEEQFYLVWPLLTLGAYWLGLRRGRPRTAVLAAFAVVVVASLTFSVWYTAHQPHAAYFVTPTRMWELGAGGLLAFVPPARDRLRHAVAAVGWVVLVGCVLGYRETMPIPGWLAVVPVLGAGAVILAGDAFVRTPSRVARPLIAVGVWVGGISYSLYLWHWPLIVLTPYATGHALEPAEKLLVLAASLLLAQLSLRLVEDPVRGWRRLTTARVRWTLVPAACAMVVVVAVAQQLVARVDARLHTVEARMTAAAATDPCFGAGAIAHGCRAAHTLRFRDAPLVTVTDQQAPPGWGRYCQQTPTGTDVTSCEFGVPESRARARLALVGDSHAGHWFGALQVLAREHRWNILMMTKSSCAVSSVPLQAAWDPSLADSCHTWTRSVLQRIAEDPSIDGVITSAIGRRYRVAGVPTAEQVARQAAGYARLWKGWARAGKRVLVLGDVPSMANGDIPTCVAKRSSETDPCTTRRSLALTPDPLLLGARAAHDPRVLAVDLHRFFCDRSRCHSVIGGMVAYGDANHMLDLFSASLAPSIDRRIAAAGPAWTALAGPAGPGH